MPLHLASQPAQATQRLRAALQAFQSQARLGPEFLSQTPLAQLRAAAPHPVYDLDLDELAKGHGLDKARLSSWRYLLYRGAELLAATELAIHPDSGEPAEVGDALLINEGQFVSATAEAIRIAEVHNGVRQGSYVLRLLRCSALYVMALWLQDNTDNADNADNAGAGDVVIPLAPAPEPLQAGHVYSGAEFIKLLHQPAVARAAFDDAPQG